MTEIDNPHQIPPMKTIHSSQTGHRGGHNLPPTSRETIDALTQSSRRGFRRLTQLFALAGGFCAASVACGQFQPGVGPIDIPVTLNINNSVSHTGVAGPYTLSRQVSNGGSTIQYTVDRPAGLSDVFFSRNRVFSPTAAGFGVEAAFVGDHGLIFKIRDANTVSENLSVVFLDLTQRFPLEKTIYSTFGSEADFVVNNPNPQLFLNADGTCLFMRVFINQSLFPDTVGLNVFRTDTGDTLCSMPDRNREGNNDRFTGDILDVLAPAGADTVRIRHTQTLSGNFDLPCPLPVPAVLPPPPPPVVQRVSIDSGNFGGNAASSSPSVSRDGRFIAFVSSATNLVPNDTNGVADVFLRDTLNGTTTRVSVRGANTQATGGTSGSPAISADGRFIVFSSSATNLVTGDTNGVSDIFVRDAVNGSTVRVSVASTGLQGNGSSSSPAISADGQIVAFSSLATNLVAGDTNGVRDVFVRGRTSNSSIRRASVATGGIQANGLSESPKLSSNGNVVAFKSRASNLVRDDRNNLMDVFVRVRSEEQRPGFRSRRVVARFPSNRMEIRRIPFSAVCQGTGA